MTSEPFGMHGMSKNATSVRKRQVAFFMFYSLALQALSSLSSL